MKKFSAFLIAFAVAFALFGCGRNDGDLGKQTTVDEANGYTLVEEVKNFRMNDDERLMKSIDGIRTDGFRTGEENKTGDIGTKSDVIALAKAEVEAKYNSVRVFFDRTQGIWKVVFSNDVQNVDEKGMKTVQSDVVETVYVDEEGYTLMTYMGEIK